MCVDAGRARLDGASERASTSDTDVWLSLVVVRIAAFGMHFAKAKSGKSGKTKGAMFSFRLRRCGTGVGTP